MENAIRRVPVMERVEVKKLLNGPEGFTPDGEYLLGPTSVKGFWVACAFCAHGLAGAGGIGKVMAEWIVEGHPEWDMWRLDVRRFGSNYNSLGYAAARTIETYTQYYDIHYPGEERLAPQPAALPHLLPPARPGLFVRRFGWERPNWFQPYEETRPRTTGLGASQLVAGHRLRTPADPCRRWSVRRDPFNKIEVRGPGACLPQPRLRQ